MKKLLYENKTFIDPGRLRFNISFYETGFTTNEFGDQVPTETLTLQTKASQQNIQNRPGSIYSQLEQEAGATLMNGDTYYTIRYRSNWHPKKNMRVEVLVNGTILTYILRAIIDVDQPVHYWRILCTTDKKGT
jgi:hypothetical protein